MIRVIDSCTAPGLLSRLHDWLVGEWGDVDTFEFQKDGVELPAPLLAMGETDLLGGLVFSSFKRPGGSESALWINALFVARDHRRQGVASMLIRAAEQEAARRKEKEIFALTDLPELYEKLGWKREQECSDGTVMSAALAVTALSQRR